MSEVYDADANAKGCFDLAIAAQRERLERSKVETDSGVLYNEDCRFILPTLRNVDSIVTDPPYHLTSIVKRFGKPNSAPAKSNGETGVFSRAARGFMGKTWDGGDIAFDPELWHLCLNALKPGGHLLSFGGTRTYHRMACAIEDAGFEIRDCIAWVYGSGFPKSHNIGDGLGTALKPAFEPIIVARRPISERTIAANVSAHGTGALNIDACRIEFASSQDQAAAAAAAQRSRQVAGRSYDGWGMVQQRLTAEEYARGSGGKGRWPANFIHDGSEEVARLFPETPGQQRSTGPEFTRKASVYGQYSDVSAAEPRNDAGSAARFFFTAKMTDDEWVSWFLGSTFANIAAESLNLSNDPVASALSDAVTSALPEGIALSAWRAHSMNVTPTELRQLAENATTAMMNIAQRCLREWQHEKLTPSSSPVSVAATREPTGTMTITMNLLRSGGSVEAVTFSITATNSEHGEAAYRFKYCAKADKDDRLKSKHPTVKPIDLMAYLIRLVTPEGGTVLDPFGGSGATAMACMREGMRFITIEKEREYFEDILNRVSHVRGDDTPLFAAAAEDTEQITLI